jgi:hypothetical protein
MGGWLRRAGLGRLADRGVVLWSVAEGARGRRWRWIISDGERVRHVGLVELDPTGGFGRLELATASGMLTLHPDADRQSIDGNVATPDGVRPLVARLEPAASLAIADDPFGSAILDGRPATEASGPRLLVRPRLGVLVEGDAPRLSVDPRGVPILEEAREWALEE